MQVTYRERHLTAGLTFSYFTIPLWSACTGSGDRFDRSNENDQAHCAGQQRTEKFAENNSTSRV